LAPTLNKLFSFVDRCIHPHEYFSRHVTTDASEPAQLYRPALSELTHERQRVW
jgi:hypothetical protein